MKHAKGLPKHMMGEGESLDVEPRREMGVLGEFPNDLDKRCPVPWCRAWDDASLDCREDLPGQCHSGRRQ